MIGFGYDIHKLVPDESLILGGINIESEFGTLAHSDGDVLLHAIIDALLGAIGLQDIGEHFPDTDPKFKGYDSQVLTRKVVNMLDDRNYSIVNIDSTIVLEKPKLMKYKEIIRTNIAELLNIDPQRVNIKATTNEGLGTVGRGEGICVYAVCEVVSK